MNNPHLIPGSFLRRDNRFRATVTVAGREAWAHVANSGRLKELFIEGRKVWLAPAGSPERVTAYDLKLVELPGGLVSADARLPNPLFAEALTAGRLPGFAYPVIEREVVYGQSRLDFRLSGSGAICWVETKSVTLVEEGTALFPDAPTARGRRHLSELIQLKKSGHRAVVIFIVQRSDARRFRPHREADPDFANALGQAAVSGVEIKAYNCQVSLENISISSEIPVELSP